MEPTELMEHKVYPVLTKYYQQTCIITQVMKSRFLELSRVTPGNSTATCQPGDIAIGGNFDVISYNFPIVGEGLANVVILYDGNETL